MESVPEFPGHLHFFKLLSLLSRRNHVMLKVPPTLISGFGFDRLTLMRPTQVGVRFETVSDAEIQEKLAVMSLYSDRDRLSLPRFLIKTAEEKLPCGSQHDVTRKLIALRASEEDFVVQPFILSPEYTAQRVRVTWTQDTGTTALLYTNELTYFKTRKCDLGAKTHRKTASVAGTPGENQYDESSLFVSPFTEPSSCSLSKSTSVLSSVAMYTKVLLEKSVLMSVAGVITSISVDMMVDITGKWFFLGIEAYQLGFSQKRGKVMSLPLSPEQSVLQGSAPTTRFPSPIPQIVLTSPPTSPKRPVLQKSTDTPKTFIKPATAQTFQSPKRPRILPSVPMESFSYILSKDKVSSPKELAQVREMEEDIAQLIGQEAHKPLTHMTYRRWKQRIDASPKRVFSLDHLYAQKLAEMEKVTRREADSQQKNLISLKNKMMEMVAMSTSKPNSMAQAVGKMLLERVSMKKVTQSTAKINAIKERITKKRSNELNRTAGMRVARSLVDYAARTIDSLKFTGQDLKKKWEEEQL